MEASSFTTNSPNSLFENHFNQCLHYKLTLVFTPLQLTRVTLTWIFFLMGLLGNAFVIYCLLTNKVRSHVHVIMLHLTLADLVFTLFTMPMDAIWNVTMSWDSIEILCKLCQMLKQFGMYISSAMVVVVAVDRMASIVLPMTPEDRRTKIMLLLAWVVSFLCSIPPLKFFILLRSNLCPGEPPFVQCVDSIVSDRVLMAPYYFFTMIMSFIIPLAVSIVSYSMILFEIKNMQRRDRDMVGKTTSSIINAKKKTLALAVLVSLSFILFWGPYYAFGIYTWFNSEQAKRVPREATMWLFILPYLRPTIHPLTYGIFMKDVKKKFLLACRKLTACFHCNMHIQEWWKFNRLSSHVRLNSTSRSSTATTTVTLLLKSNVIEEDSV